jgi:hypothetical protein
VTNSSNRRGIWLEIARGATPAAKAVKPPAHREAVPPPRLKAASSAWVLFGSGACAIVPRWRAERGVERNLPRDMGSGRALRAAPRSRRHAPHATTSLESLRGVCSRIVVAGARRHSRPAPRRSGTSLRATAGTRATAASRAARSGPRSLAVRAGRDSRADRRFRRYARPRDGGDERREFAGAGTTGTARLAEPVGSLVNTSRPEVT